MNAHELDTLNSIGIQAGWYFDGSVNVILVAMGDQLREIEYHTYAQAERTWTELRRAVES